MPAIPTLRPRREDCHEISTLDIRSNFSLHKKKRKKKKEKKKDERMEEKKNDLMVTY